MDFQKGSPFCFIKNLKYFWSVFITNSLTKVLLENGCYSKQMITEGESAIPLETTLHAFRNQEKTKQRSTIVCWKFKNLRITRWVHLQLWYSDLDPILCGYICNSWHFRYCPPYSTVLLQIYDFHSDLQIN